MRGSFLRRRSLPHATPSNLFASSFLISTSSTLSGTEWFSEESQDTSMAPLLSSCNESLHPDLHDEIAERNREDGKQTTAR